MGCSTCILHMCGESVTVHYLYIISSMSTEEGRNDDRDVWLILWVREFRRRHPRQTSVCIVHTCTREVWDTSRSDIPCTLNPNLLIPAFLTGMVQKISLSLC